MEFNEIINSSKPTLVDFYADWCSPCRILSPIIEQTKNSVGEDATVLKIDVDNNREVVRKYQIKTVPTLLIFKEGEIVWRQSGVISKEMIIDALKKYSTI